MAPLWLMAQYTGGIGRGDYGMRYLPCTNPSSGGAIARSASICSGSVPAVLTDSVAPTGFNGTLKYQWQSSVTGNNANFSDITGATQTGYSPGALTVTTWFRRMAGVTCKADWVGAAASNVVEITITPISVASLAASDITTTSAI